MVTNGEACNCESLFSTNKLVEVVICYCTPGTTAVAVVCDKPNPNPKDIYDALGEIIAELHQECPVKEIH